MSIDSAPVTGNSAPVTENKDYSMHYCSLALTIVATMVVTCIVCGILGTCGEYGVLQMSALTTNALLITSLVLFCINGVVGLTLRLGRC